MTILQSDVKMYASGRMTDYADGGGRMSPTVIVDGLDNNAFPDVTDIDRLMGRSNVRKLFGAVISNNTDPYLSAFAFLDDAPDDSAIDGLLVAYGNYATERAAVAAAFAVAPTYTNIPGTAPLASTIVFTGAFIYDEWNFTVTAASATITSGAMSGNAVYLVVGEPITITVAGVTYARTISSITPADAGNSYTLSIGLDATLPVSGSGCPLRRLRATNPRAYGVGISSAGASSGASSITVDQVFARLVPVDLASAYPTASNSQWLVAPVYYNRSQGQVQVIQPGDGLLIHSTIAMSPATVSNGQTVNTTRTTLARLRVIGDNGVEHARFTRGVTAPTGVGCTADLDAGTVTFSDVSGMSQPVTVEHRIEEMVAASTVSVGSGAIGLNRNLSRTFPADTKVSSLAMLGDLVGRVWGMFPQSAWTGVFSDAVIGGTPTADFNDTLYPVVTTNKGAITERWALVFTNTTAFRCIGELTGEITGGNTAIDYAPTNPVTSAPYFTIPTSGWGSGWAAGNVLRFNTDGCNSPLWLIRTIAPSVPGGTDSMTAEFRGYVNA